MPLIGVLWRPSLPTPDTHRSTFTHMCGPQRDMDGWMGGYICVCVCIGCLSQIARGSLTVLGIGPCLADEADSVCGHLKLL